VENGGDASDDDVLHAVAVKELENPMEALRHSRSSLR